MKTVLVTGGSGFIGSNFLNRFVPDRPDLRFVNVDSLTYAANPLSTKALEGTPNYFFERIDITNGPAIRSVFSKHNPDWVLHFAAESHVDRSITGPAAFVTTNVLGTFSLLEACREKWSDGSDHLFLHVSTDEVYGALGESGCFSEVSPYRPSSPYSASKAGADHLVRAYHTTYGLPVRITHSSNNYGPFQFPEKLVPLMIRNAIKGEPLPVYGKGKNIRDWLHVTDHCEAIFSVLQNGQTGETYNIASGTEMTNLQVVETICDAVASATNADNKPLHALITEVPDRPGHDFRYALDTSKIRSELRWRPRRHFAQGISETVAWYIANPAWIDACGNPPTSEEA